MKEALLKGDDDRKRGKDDGPTGFIEGILPIQDELVQFTNFLSNIVALGREFLEDEFRRITGKAQPLLPTMTPAQRLALTNALGDYVREKNQSRTNLIRLAQARAAVNALHFLVDFESNSGRLKMLHENKNELLMYTFQLLVGALRSLNTMSSRLKAADDLLP